MNCYNYVAEPPQLTQVEIIVPPQPPELGQSYVPQCIVTPPESLPANIVVQWIAPDGTVIESASATRELSLPLNFNSLTPTDAGLYVCKVVVTSPLSDSPETILRTLDLMLPVNIGM